MRYINRHQVKSSALPVKAKNELGFGLSWTDGEEPVTDEIYDYFGGNAPKKVEPIEDDDLDSVEADAAEEKPPTVEDEPGRC